MFARFVDWLTRIVEYLYNQSNVYFVARYRHIIGNLPVDHDRLILEIGSGDRILWTQHLAARSRFVIAMDIEPEKVLKARSLARRRHCRLPNVAWVVGDLTALPFRSEAYDAATCMDVLEHVPNHEIALSELVRVLQDRAMAVITTMCEERRHYIRPLIFDNHIREYTMGSLEELCESTSARVEKRFTFYKPLTTVLREIQLLVLPRPRLPLVNLGLNLPLGFLARFGELYGHSGGGLGVVIRKDKSRSL